MASHVQRTLTSDVWIKQILTGVHLACWHFESYFIDIAYNYVRRTTRCFKQIKKNIAVVQGCIWCIIHYDRNVMEKEVGRLTEASFSTMWRSADVLQMQHFSTSLQPCFTKRQVEPVMSQKSCISEFDTTGIATSRMHESALESIDRQHPYSKLHLSEILWFLSRSFF